MPKVTAADFLLNHCKRVIAVNFLQLQKNLNVVQVRAIGCRSHRLPGTDLCGSPSDDDGCENRDTVDAGGDAEDGYR